MPSSPTHLSKSREYTLFLLITAVAGGVGCGTHRDAETLQLSSGRLVKVVRRETAEKAFTFEYCASHDLSDVPALRREVQSIWQDIRQQAEQSGPRRRRSGQPLAIGTSNGFRGVHMSFLTRRSRSISSGSPLATGFSQAGLKTGLIEARGSRITTSLGNTAANG